MILQERSAGAARSLFKHFAPGFTGVASPERDLPMDHPKPFGRHALVSVALAALLLSACNTTSGFGQDVGAAGDALSEAAEDAKSE